MPKRFNYKPLTRERKQYLLENADKATVEQLSKEVERSPKSVAKWLRNQGFKPVWENKENEGLGAFSEKIAAKENLRASRVWDRLKKKFTEDEVLYFEEQYAALVIQFKDDIFATEENQVHKLITYDILMDRNMIQRKKLLGEIDMIEREIKTIAQSVSGDFSGLDEKMQGRLEYLTQQVLVYREQDRSMTKEYTELEGHHHSIMKALKGTRDQRISKIESSKTTFIGLLKRLQEEEARNHEGMSHALMEAATKKEYVRLAKPHKYMDGNEDQPILSADTIDFLEELHKDEQTNIQ